VLPKEFGMWPQGSYAGFLTLLLYEDPKCELGLNLSPSIYASDWPKPRAANMRVISEVEESLIKRHLFAFGDLRWKQVCSARHS
jgi:hypothetical protein